MEGQNTEPSIDTFVSGRLRKTVVMEDMIRTFLPQFIAGKEKVRFKLKNCVVDSMSAVEGDENCHVFYYFKPPVDPDYELNIEFRDGRIVPKGQGKWGNIGELVDLDEELKNWMTTLYTGGMIRTTKRIDVTRKEEGSRVEISVKKLEKDWRDALNRMSTTPRAIVETMFNVASRLITGISNWQGKQVDPWNPNELARGRAVAIPPTAAGPAALSAVPSLGSAAAIRSAHGTGSLGGLPVIPSDESDASISPEAEAGVATAGPPVLCPMCGCENPPGSKTCKRCLSALD